MSKVGTILVLGASGNVGSALTRRLVAAGVQVRALYAPADEDHATFPAGVQKFPGSFSDEALLRSAMESAEAAFMLTPPSPSQPEWHQKIIDAAHRTGVRRIVKLSAFDSGNESLLQMGRWHHHGEQLLRDSGLDYVILRPQYFMQMLRQPLHTALQTGVFAGAAAGFLRMGFVDVRDIAAVAAVALTTSLLNGRTLVPTGPSAPSFEEIAEKLQEASGRPVRYDQRSEREIRETRTFQGWPEWHLEDYLRIHNEAASGLVTADVQNITGNQPRSIEHFIRQDLVLQAGAAARKRS